jgi:23S rRNA (uracil1939-C5)-methyltransferase
LSIIVKADLPAYGGFSIGRLKGRVVMIKSALPGETVEAEIEEEKKDYYIASAIKVLEPSPDRIKPSCKFFSQDSKQCGGCRLQYISYERQVALKEETLLNCLHRIAKIETPLSEPLSASPWNYRFRGQFKVSGKSMGFYKEKSREVVDIDRCPLMRDEVNEYFNTAKNLFHELDEKDISEVHISYGDSASALIKIKNGTAADLKRLSKSFLNSGFSSVYVDSGSRVSKSGKGYITFDLEGLKYTVSPMSFFQSHWELNRKVVNFIKENLQPLNDKRALDLYSGAGNFSLPIALDAAEVIAVEENPFAIEDGKRNAELNGIRNCRFIRSSIEALRLKDKADIILIDPPRLGLTNAAIEKILKTIPERIVYISCNPTTFARDLKKLFLKYGIESLNMIDFFPQTYHIEAIAFLRLR